VVLTDTELVIAVAGVCVLAAVLMVLARRHRATPAPPPLSAVEAGRLVLARTHDGTHYQGAFVEMGGPGEFLTLAGPIVFRRVGAEPETMPAVWDRLTLPLSDVAEVWTRSTPTVEVAAPKERDAAAPAPATTSADEAAARLLQSVRDDDRRQAADAPADDGSATEPLHTRRHRRSAPSAP
jgi:hypothetical protein